MSRKKRTWCRVRRHALLAGDSLPVRLLHIVYGAWKDERECNAAGRGQASWRGPGFRAATRVARTMLRRSGSRAPSIVVALELGHSTGDSIASAFANRAYVVMTWLDLCLSEPARAHQAHLPRLRRRYCPRRRQARPSACHLRRTNFQR